MYTERQQKSLELLKEYFDDTPEEEIQEGIDYIKSLKSAGPTVKEYFDNFHTAFTFGFPEREYVFNKVNFEKPKESNKIFQLTELQILFRTNKRDTKKDKIIYNIISSVNSHVNQYGYV